MLIKKETEYAILGLIHLAKNGDENFVDIREFARKNGLSENLLPKTFLKLASAGIVESKVGPNGGFRLLKDPKEISLWSVFSAVQIPNVLKCYAGKAAYCKLSPCPLHHTVAKMEKYMQEYLTNSSLDQLISESTHDM